MSSLPRPHISCAWLLVALRTGLTFCHCVPGSKGIVKLHFMDTGFPPLSLTAFHSQNAIPDQLYEYIPIHRQRATVTSLALKTNDSVSPICVTPKPKCRSKAWNVFYDNRGFPDQSDEFNHLLHNIDGRVILRKKKHPHPPLDINNSTFNYIFDESLHAEKIKSMLSLNHLAPSEAAAKLL